MTKKNSLNNIKILLADSDGNIGSVLADVLARMGFKQVQFVRDGASAIKALEAERKDILITEWQMQSVDGIQLTNFIRNSADPAIRLLPIIMLTARAERQDVEAARDAGITEFVVKPYNSRTVFQRIQEVIENPRGFMVAPQYVGPDRRRRAEDAQLPEDRRKAAPDIVSDPRAAVRQGDMPKLILPEALLKKMLGLESLDALITPQLLDDAQKAIDDLKDQALVWIKQYLDKLDLHYQQLAAGASGEVIEAMQQSLLSIKSNAGTFGYTAASGVAQLLYKFMRFDFVPGDGQHMQLVLKHMQSLKVLLGNAATGKTMEKENLLLAGLKMMVSKFQKKK